MRTLNFILLLLFATSALSQDNVLIKQIDSTVLRIEANKGRVEKFRWLLGHMEYTTITNDLVKIIHSYKAGPKQIIQTFYFQDSALVFAMQQATSYYLYGDSVSLLGKYYFDDYTLKYHYLSEEEGKKDINQIEQDILTASSKAQKGIYRHVTRPSARLFR